MNYSKAIKTIRAIKELSQSEFSETIGFDQSLISRIESGKRKPSDNNLKVISKKLGIPFYLVMLLASEKEDLKNISEKKAKELGYNLLQLFSK